MKGIIWNPITVKPVKHDIVCLVYFVNDFFPRGDFTFAIYDVRGQWLVQEPDNEFYDWSDVITHWAYLNRPETKRKWKFLRNIVSKFKTN